jgi:PmbA protein
MLAEQTLLDAVAAAVEAAMAAGAEWADAVASSGHATAVQFERNTIRQSSTHYRAGLGVRAFVRGGMGLAKVSSLDLASVRAVGQQAAELARAASPDPDFRRLPEPQPLPDPPPAFDQAVAGLPARQLVEWCAEAIERGRAAAERVFMAGGAGAAASVWALASSTGISLATRFSSLSLGVTASVWEGEEAASFEDGAWACRLEDFKWQHLPAQTVEQAKRLLHDQPLPTGRRDLVLDYEAAYWWLEELVHCANGEDVQRQRSFMIGKQGEQVASPVLTVIEDPFIPFSGSAGFDGEGVPRQRRKLIDGGVLTTYLHNSYTAGKAGVPPTGHAARGGYDPAVDIAASNLLVQPGDKPLQQLIADVEEGILVVMGAPSPHPVSGQVSSTIDGGFLIKHGQLSHPVKGAMLAGHIFEFLANIDAVSSDYREEPGRIMPAVRIRDVLVSGC